MVGSEGPLGIITKAVVKLRPYPSHNLVLLVPFASAEQACGAVSAIFMSGINPSCLEFMERDALEWAIAYSESIMQLPIHIQAHLLIEIDGNDMEMLLKEAEQIYQVLNTYDVGDILLGESF